MPYQDHSGKTYGMLTARRRVGRHYACDCVCGKEGVLIATKKFIYNKHGCGNHLPASSILQLGEARILAWSVAYWRFREMTIYGELRRYVVRPYCTYHIADRPATRLLPSFTDSKLICYKVWNYHDGIKEPDLIEKWTKYPLLQHGMRNTVFERIYGSSPNELIKQAKDLAKRQIVMLRRKYGEQRPMRANHTIVMDGDKWFAVVLVVLK